MGCPLPPGHATGNGVQDYNKGCRCPRAVTANSEYRARRRRLIAYGRATEETHTDADLVLRHIRKLKAAGMSYTRIAAHAGVSPTVVEELVSGARSRIRPTTMAKILRVQPAAADLAAQGYVNATGTARRLRALAVLGYSPTSIGRRAGIPSSSIARAVSGDYKMLRADHAAAITRIYDELWSTPLAPANDREAASRTWTIRNAQAHGWVPPLAWDDERIDDPAYQPNVTPRTKKSRDEAAHDRLDDLAHLINAGVPAEEAAHRAGYPNAKAAYSAAQHQGLNHLSDALINAVTVAARERRTAA